MSLRKLALGLAACYAFLVRPRIVRWGATEDEVNGPFPGAATVPDGIRSPTMAVTIDAPPSKVWPWLIQMGVDRAGWYSWDVLDNFGRPSSDYIYPPWQNVAVGDRFTAKPDGTEWWEVAEVEPERFLSLRMTLDLRGREYDPAGPRPRFYTDSSWSFLLNELPGGRTRLVVSGYWSFRPRWFQPILGSLVIEPTHWIMQSRQFTNLKRRAERPD